MGIESMIEENIISLLKNKGYEFKNEQNDSWLNNRNFDKISVGVFTYLKS